ncbi:low molecular weight phosphotyrosine protein phosphatase [Vibrio sp. S9_S30]|uniref:low molecular weight phosphotyrosine protein phosphatase n=1 Tax=Vibrio sp. S9_S30 TaxID=2720226 RepID=UPI00168114F6
MSKVLVVCLGNICRSPTGEAVLKAKSRQKGFDLIVDSAGTQAYHCGEKPDQRSMQAGERRGYSFKGMTSRKIRLDDFERFDLILAADHTNLSDLQQLCPPEHQHKLKLFLSFSDSQYDEIPDPYYGGENGFEMVIDLIEDASDALLKQLLE